MDELLNPANLFIIPVKGAGFIMKIGLTFPSIPEL